MNNHQSVVRLVSRRKAPQDHHVVRQMKVNKQTHDMFVHPRPQRTTAIRIFLFPPLRSLVGRLYLSTVGFLKSAGVFFCCVCVLPV